MADQLRSKIIEDNPIGKSLDAFRASFNSDCDDKGISRTPDAVDQLGQNDLQNLAFDLILALQGLRASRSLPSSGREIYLVSDLIRFASAVNSNDFDSERTRLLLKAALADNLDDTLLWARVYDAVRESTPPPRPVASALQQTPWNYTTSGFVNSSEMRDEVDRVLKLELGPLYVGLPRFRDTYFGGVAGLEAASETVFKKCLQGSSPLFGTEGWRGWPADARERDVVAWFNNLIPKLEEFAKDCRPASAPWRKLLMQPTIPLLGSTGRRSLDIGFIDNCFIGDHRTTDFRYRWSDILVPGELKSNPADDILSVAQIGIAKYAREVFSAQDRRFVLGFTLCGSLMRIWAFDRLGGIASLQFDINKDGLQFVSTMLGFLWMNKEALGFDPTFMTRNDGQQFIEIERDGTTERLIVEQVIGRTRCIVGRATTIRKAYREGDPSRRPLVIKDSWQFPEREEEGALLREATSKGVVRLGRHYFHETARVGGMDDDIQDNIRKGLDVTTAENYRPDRSPMSRSPSVGNASQKSRLGRSSLPRSTGVADTSQEGRGNVADRKRPFSPTGVFPPPTKRCCSMSPTKAGSNPLPNRVHRRVILCDYGEPIYHASSLSALLAALEGCIEGHESLWRAGFLHRDISISNLMINEDANNPSWPSFMIDLDFAIQEQRNGVSGAKGKTGTRAFMAIGILKGEQHSFMHDLESFFWVLFWVCIHFQGPGAGKGRVVAEFDAWSHTATEALVKTKLGTVVDISVFTNTITSNFTPYYQPFVPLMIKLRKVVFPGGRPWEQEDPRLYLQMREILREWRNTSV